MYSIPLCNLRGDSSVLVVNRSAARIADSADPTTDTREDFAHPITDHNRNTSHWVKVVIASSSSSPSPHYALSSMSTQSPPLLRVFTIAAHYVRPNCLYFVFLGDTPRPVVCSRASPVPLCHPSFFYNLYDYALQSFPLLSSANPIFFVQGVHSATQSPPYTITLVTIAARSVPELRPFPQIKNASPTQMSPQWSEAVEKPTGPYLVHNDSSEDTLSILLTLPFKQPTVLPVAASLGQHPTDHPASECAG